MSATTYSDIIADTSIKTAGPEGNPFYNIHWLAKEDIKKPNTNPPIFPYNKHRHSPPPKLWYYQTTVTPVKHTFIFEYCFSRDLHVNKKQQPAARQNKINYLSRVAPF